MSLEWSCIVCKAKPGTECHNIVDRGPLPGRQQHWARALPPNPKEGK